jgi:hypothetical protein
MTTDIDDFLLGVSVHIIEPSRKVMYGHVFERKVPENTLFLSIVLMR